MNMAELNRIRAMYAAPEEMSAQEWAAKRATLLEAGLLGGARREVQDAQLHDCIDHIILGHTADEAEEWARPYTLKSLDILRAQGWPQALEVQTSEVLCKGGDFHVDRHAQTAADGR